jgi:Co/Zn/Cd efflux system component
MRKTIFEIAQMDCPSEEQLIRIKLEALPSVKHLEFDLPERRLTVFHDAGATAQVAQLISTLHLGDKQLHTEETDQKTFAENVLQRKLLWTVLAINFGFFIIEMTTGLLSDSMGLLADSLDMLADAFVYGISLLAVGGSILLKKRIAGVAGYFQIMLAIVGFVTVVRRFLWLEKLPDYSTMIVISGFALIANAICLYLLQKSKSEEAHMQASMIFTSNDVMINLGVIVAGALVFWTGSAKPDLIIGTIVFVVVLRGALRILKLS